MTSRLRVLGPIAFAAAVLTGCGDDDRTRSPLAVSDHRLGAIEQRASRLDAVNIDEVMLSIDAEAYRRPGGATFRDAVTRFYQAIHPSCLSWSREETEQESDFIAEVASPLGDFNVLVARLGMTPLRRDLELAWQRAALSGRKTTAPRDCASSGTQRDIMRNSQARMRDALDRMEAVMSASAS